MVILGIRLITKVFSSKNCYQRVWFYVWRCFLFHRDSNDYHQYELQHGMTTVGSLISPHMLLLWMLQFIELLSNRLHSWGALWGWWQQIGDHGSVRLTPGSVLTQRRIVTPARVGRFHCRPPHRSWNGGREKRRRQLVLVPPPASGCRWRRVGVSWRRNAVFIFSPGIDRSSTPRQHSEQGFQFYSAVWWHAIRVGWNVRFK